MRSRLALLILIVLSVGANARADDEAPPRAPPELYAKAFGDPKSPALVFVHGGPGYNCFNFEATTAERLAASHSVVVYDQRGCGRSSAGDSADFTFARATADLDGVLDRFRIEKPILLGHSFGGAVALRYLDAHPDRVSAVVLVSAPVSYPAALENVVKRARRAYEERRDEQGLAYLAALMDMDPASPEYAGSVFMNAMHAGLYNPSRPSPEASALYRKLAGAKDAALVSDSRGPPFLGFVANERYTTLDLAPLVEKRKDRVFAVYGDEDWTLDSAGRASLEGCLPAGHFFWIEGASHNIFIDQQTRFIEALAAIEKRATK
jgi:proline iminopeptidase